MPRRYMTAKQERFCLLIVRGEPATHAYTAAGYSAATPGTAAAAACKLIKTAKIENRIAELREAAAIAASVSVETLTRELLEIRVDATADGQHGAAVAAIAMIAKLNGLVVDKKDISVTQHKPGWIQSAVELSQEDWQRQFSLPPPQPQLSEARTTKPDLNLARPSRARPADLRTGRDHLERVKEVKIRMRKRARQAANDVAPVMPDDA